jgi:signal transduction histidine kinase
VTRLRPRSLLAVVAGVALILAVVVTLRYRSTLEQRLHRELNAAAVELAAVNSPQELKALVPSLALEGISVELPAGGGRAARKGPTKHDPTLVTENATVDAGGGPTRAVLDASTAEIGREVSSLVITEAIGVVVVVALMVLLARALGLRDAAVADARRSEAAMRRFLADASHELRNPLAAAHATAERLLREQPERPARDAVEAQLARETGRLGRLVDDLLNMARIEAEEHPPREPVDLAEVGAAAARDCERVSLEAPVPVAALGDRDALIRAVRNVVDNALAVSEDVSIAVTAEGDCARLAVTDNGPGVPPEDRDRIFDRFVRLHGGPASGTGLGLAIARAIVRGNGGELTYEPGPTGATFVLRLPLQHRAP